MCVYISIEQLVAVNCPNCSGSLQNNIQLFGCQKQPSRVAGAFITTPQEKCDCGAAATTTITYTNACSTFSSGAKCTAGDTQVSTTTCSLFFTGYNCRGIRPATLDTCKIVALTSTVGFNEDVPENSVDGNFTTGLDNASIAIISGVAGVTIIVAAVVIGVYLKSKKKAHFGVDKEITRIGEKDTELGSKL